MLLNRGKKLVRVSLIGALWPDLPESRGLRRLSQALWSLGKVWPTDSEQPLLLTTRETIELNPDVDIWVDVFEFERRLALREVADDDAVEARIDDLGAAVALYRGDLLQGTYDDWVLMEQERLKQQYLTALVELSRLLKSTGDLAGALTNSRLLTFHAPLREEAHREVIRLCHLLGRTSEAIEQYRACCEILDDELGVGPEPETVALYERLANTVDEPPPAEPVAEPMVLAPKFVGRDTERVALIGCLEEALAGRGASVLIEGDVGVGKSRLVEQIGDDAEWRGFDVAVGACPAVSRPYAALADAMAAALTRLRVLQLAETVDPVWLREVSRLVPAVDAWLPELPPATDLDRGDDRTRMQEALARVLVAAARVRPLFIAIEDVHLADGDTMLAVRALAESTSHAPVVLTVTYRGDEARHHGEVWDALRNLDATAGTRRIALGALDAASTAELVRNVGVGATPEFLSAVHRETGGNPLFTLETLRAVADGGAVETDRDLPVASTVHEVIAQRLERLSPSARQVLRAAAVNQDPVTPEAVALIGDMSVGEASTGIEEALRRSLTVEVDQGYRFDHDQVRRIVYDDIPREDRVTMHRRAGEMLEQTEPESAAALAHHFTNAEAWDKAAGYNRRAAEAATEARSYALAADHYALAIDAATRADVPAGDLAELALSHESILDGLGHRAEQASALDLAEDAGDGATVDILRRRALLLANVDRFDEAVAVATRAVEMAEAGDSPSELVGVRTALGRILSWWGRSADAVAPLEAAAAQTADDGDAARAHLALGIALADVQEYDRAVEALERASALYRSTGEPQGLALALGGLARVSMERGETEAARASYLEAIELCETVGYRYGEGLNEVNLGNLEHSSGRVAEAFDRYETAMAVFRSIGNRRLEAMTSLNAATVLDELFGSDDRAAADAQSALAFLEEVGDERGQAQGLEVLGSLAISAGDLGAAREHLGAGLALARSCGHHWLEVQILITLARLELEADDPDAARRWLAAATELCRRDDLSDLLVQARAVEASALLAVGSVDEALTASSEAVAGLKAGVSGPHFVWWAHHEAALAAGQDDEAAEALAAAHRDLDSLLRQLEPDERERSLAGVAAHRAIHEVWTASQPCRLRVEIPGADAPTGRPLRDHEHITVEWTVAHPDDERISGATARRRHRLLRLTGEAVEQGAAPTVEDLAEALGVSRSTIRRDLSQLRDAGHDVRTRGTRRTG